MLKSHVVSRFNCRGWFVYHSRCTHSEASFGCFNPSVLSQQLGTGALGGKGGRRRALLLWMMEEFAARQAEPLLSTRLCTLW
jgi:hypothetical protein